MNKQALHNLLSLSRAKIRMIDADLRTTNGPWDGEKMYSQGYQTGRRAELESLVSTLEIALTGDAA